MIENTIIKSVKSKNKSIIVFDDGLQDRKVSYNLQFVCFDFGLKVGNNNLIPAGPLREKLQSLKKYDAIFLKDVFDKKNFYKIFENLTIK